MINNQIIWWLIWQYLSEHLHNSWQAGVSVHCTARFPTVQPLLSYDCSNTTSHHITSTILALIIQISSIWQSHTYFLLITASRCFVRGKLNDKSSGKLNVHMTPKTLPLCNEAVPLQYQYFLGYNDENSRTTSDWPRNIGGMRWQRDDK